METTSEQSGAVILIGSGNIAWALGSAIQNTNGIEVKAVVSRNLQSGGELADYLGCPFSKNFKPEFIADYTILCVPDKAISSLAMALTQNKTGILLHCSGSMPLAILPTTSPAGVLYPLQTFHKSARSALNNTTPLLIEASAKDTYQKVAWLAKQLSQTVHQVDSAQRFYYHMAAVIFNNFITHLAGLTQEFGEKHALKKALFEPLIDKTVQMFKEQRAKSIQTGPAQRNDQEVIQKHLTILRETDPQLAEVYACLTQSIQHTHKK